jgi:hypothetical protein
MAQFQHVMGFFGTFQPEIGLYLLNSDATSPMHPTGSILLARCGYQDHVLTMSCIYQMAEEWGISNDPINIGMEASLFKNRLFQEIQIQKQAEMQHALSDYIASLGLPEEIFQKVMFYFRKKESMKAITILYENGFQEEPKSLFETLNTIQQTSQYRIIEPTEAKPKLN